MAFCYFTLLLDRDSETPANARTPLLRFAVDLFDKMLWIRCTASCTTNREEIELVEFGHAAPFGLGRPLLAQSRD